MPKNNCLFQTTWLEHEWFKHWIRKKMTLLQYAIIALKMSVLPIWKRILVTHSLVTQRIVSHTSKTKST